jgi:hypothetical protein
LVVVSVVVVGVPDVDDDDEPCERLGLGFGVVEVVVEVVGAVVVVVTVPAGVVAVTVGHDWEVVMIGRLTGSGSELGGVSGGTFWNTNVCPPATVTVTVQPSADASGSTPRPSTATVQPKVATAIFSFRLVTTVAYSPRGLPLA